VSTGSVCEKASGVNTDELSKDPKRKKKNIHKNAKSKGVQRSKLNMPPKRVRLYSLQQNGKREINLKMS